MNEELKVIISAEISKLKAELNKGKQELNKFGKEGEKTGKLKDVFSKIGKGIGIAGAAIGAATAAIGAIVGGMFELVEATEEYTKAQAKIKTAFETAGSSAKQAKDTYNGLYRVLGDTDKAVEAGSHLAKITTNQKDLAEWTKICQGAYATFGDSLPIESLTEAANETIKTGELTGALADALNWAGVNEDEFADKLFWANTEAEREALIRETLNGLYDEAAEGYEKNAADLIKANEAEAAYTEGMAALGEALRPIVSLMKGEFAQVLKDIAPYLQLAADAIKDILNGDISGGVDKLAEGLKGVFDIIGNLLTELLPKIVEFAIVAVAAILEALPELITGIIDAVVAIALALPELLAVLVETVPDIIIGLVDAVIAALPVLIQGVMDLVLGIVEALPRIITVIVETIPTLLTTVIKGVVDALPQIIDGLIGLITGVVDALPDILTALITAIPTLIGNLMLTVVECLPAIIAALIKLVARLVVAIPEILISLITAIVKVFMGLVETVIKVFTNLPSAFKTLFTKAFDAIKGAFGGFGDYFSGLWNKITNVFSNAGSFFSGVFNKIKGAFSKIGSAIGDSVGDTVKAAINGVLSNVVEKINGFIGAINSAIGVINKIPGVNIGKIGKLSVPKLERGGVLEKGQIGLLEGNGAEAVVPLEKNTEWLDKIADRLIGSLGGGSDANIYLQIDGKTFAQVSCDSINALTRQRGAIPLKIV